MGARPDWRRQGTRSRDTGNRSIHTLSLEACPTGLTAVHAEDDLRLGVLSANPCDFESIHQHSVITLTDFPDGPPFDEERAQFPHRSRSTSSLNGRNGRAVSLRTPGYGWNLVPFWGLPRIAWRDKSTKTFRSAQLMRLAHAGETRTFFPNHQLFVSTTR